MGTLISREDFTSSHVTKKFTKYGLPMSNNENGEQGQIVLYDSPGLTEDENVILEFKKWVDKKLNLFKDKKENTSILLCFVKRSDEISDTVLDFLNFMNNKKLNIFLVITHSKKNSEKSNEYRLDIIDRLKKRNIFTDNNLSMLNNNGQNIIPVNLKEDKELGEFYGFSDIYRAILKLFPENFISTIKEFNELKDIDQQIGFILYKKYFFLDNVKTKNDFLLNASNKIEAKIKISASISSFLGLCPIPFGDIPVIIALEIGIIKYAAKLYGFNDNEYNIIKLLTLGVAGFNLGSVLGGVSKILLFSQVLDIIPVIGCLVSSIANPGTIISFGYSIKSFFLKNINDEKIRIIITNTLNDYKSIYMQIKNLYSNENIKISKANNGINLVNNISRNNNPIFINDNKLINRNSNLYNIQALHSYKYQSYNL